MVTRRSDVVEHARTYLGVPYVHQGRTRHGLDCIGLVVRVAHDLGLSAYEISHYARVPSGRLMIRLLKENCQAIPPSTAQPGDLLHIAYGKQPQHLAIVTERGMIHADSRHGVVEHGLIPDRIRGAYRLPGVT